MQVHSANINKILVSFMKSVMHISKQLYLTITSIYYIYLLYQYILSIYYISFIYCFIISVYYICILDQCIRSIYNILLAETLYIILYDTTYSYSSSSMG